MNALAIFENELTSLIGRPTKPRKLRPFVCEGSPLECDVFIVGLNPATKMSADFWQFWRSDHGFDKKAWFEAYKKERKLRPLRPGQKHRTEVSRTRGVIECILEEAGSVQCLETNIYADPTERGRDLPHSQRVTAPFDYLLKRIKPGLIVVHGRDAATHVKGNAATSRVIAVSHFASRGWSAASARALGQRIKEHRSTGSL